jgi:alpha-1,3-fucosyltransferase 10
MSSLRDPISSTESPEFLEFLSNYKFVFAMENAICNDYITEELWRTFRIGSVPVFFGPENINDILPTSKSIINIRDFPTAADLARFLTYLNENDTEYESYLIHKHKNGTKSKNLIDLMAAREWGINNDQTKGNLIDKFECLICERIHENIDLKRLERPQKQHQATIEHYGCPRPSTFDKSGAIKAADETTNWLFTYEMTYCMQEIFFEYYMPMKTYNFSMKKLQSDALEYHKNVYSKNISIRDLM